MKKSIVTCICCPMGCQLTVSCENATNISVSGNSCARGVSYGQKEMTNPTRTVTTTVKVACGKERMLPVKTASDIPKEKIFDCLEALKNIEVEAPVKIGDVIVQNVTNCGVDIVATNNIAKA